MLEHLLHQPNVTKQNESYIQWNGVHPQYNGNVFILMKFSSLAALEVVNMTTSSAASDGNFAK